MNSLLNIAFCLLFSQTGSWQRELNEINFTHNIYFDQDATYFITSSEPFGGDCTYILSIDSIRNNEFFISGKYESDVKCMESGAKDTIRLGILADGIYKINYSFIDIQNYYQTETFTTNFTVSLQNIQKTEKNPDFTVQTEKNKGVVFILKNNNANNLLSIFDASGKKHKVYSMKEGKLKINDLLPGIYLYRLENKKEILYNGKFTIRD